jgi:hypothetical protein
MPAVSMQCCSIFKNDDPSTNLGYIRFNKVFDDHHSLFDVKFEANKFDKFDCVGKIYLNVNTKQFYDIISTVNKNEWITMYIDDAEKYVLYIKINNYDDSKNRTYKLVMLDIPFEHQDIPMCNFHSQTTMASHTFYEYCEKLRNVGNCMRLECLSNVITVDKIMPKAFIMSDSKGLVRIVCEENECNIEIETSSEIYCDPNRIMMFADFAQVCKTLELYLKEGYPVVIKYGFKLGRLLLAVINMNMDFNDFDDLDDFDNNIDNNFDL